MSKSFNTFLIDPHNETITEVMYNGDYKEVYGHIDCDCFDVVTVNKQGDGLYVDDEGLFKSGQAFFKHADYPTPLAGKAFVLGCDKHGETVAPAMTLQDLQDKIAFVIPVRVNGEEILWLDHNGKFVHISKE